MSFAGSVEPESTVGNVLTFASIGLSVLVSLGPLPAIIRIRNSRDTLGYPALPYFSAIICSSLWLSYGILANSFVLILANAFGFFTGCIYVLVYSYFAWKVFHRKITNFAACSLLVLLMVTLITYWGMFRVVKGAALTSFFVFISAPCVVLVKVVRLQDASILPIELPTAIFVNSIGYCLYGYLVLNDFVLWGTAVVSLLIASLQISCYLFFRLRSNAVK